MSCTAFLIRIKIQLNLMFLGLLGNLSLLTGLTLSSNIKDVGGNGVCDGGWRLGESCINDPDTRVPR